MKLIKTTNQKYIVIIGFFILTLLLSPIIPIKYIQLFNSPIMLILITYIFKDEIKNMNWNTVLKNEAAYNHVAYILILALLSQIALNCLSGLFISPSQSIVTTILLPVIPIYTLISAPIIEETIFRRIIFGTLQRNKEKFSIIAATISSLLFATMHLSTVLFAGYFAIGMILCYFYHKSKSIYIVILAHAAFNFFALFQQSIHT